MDVSPTMDELAARRLGAGRALMSLPESEHASFEAATLWCVVAHTRDPSVLLDVARNALRPCRILWLTTPNFALQKRSTTISSDVGRGNFANDDQYLHFTAQWLTSSWRSTDSTALVFQ